MCIRDRVEDDPVGRRQNALNVRMQIIDRRIRRGVLALDEVIDHARLKRPRAKQRNQRDDVLETVGLQTADEILDAARLELKNRGSRCV